MNINSFYSQVSLLTKVLPIVGREKVFALKGGTAINLFVRDMPRLSVDIDLTFLPILNREETFTEIFSALQRIKKNIEESLLGAKVKLIQAKSVPVPTSFYVAYQNIEIKVEVNFVLRGSAFPTVISTLCKSAVQEFNIDIEVVTLSIADLYGGKICAALDRQHPRDLFDIMILQDNEGITEEIRKSFIVYLASHSRPMNELLAPNFKDISLIYENEFIGMTKHSVELSSLYAARLKLLATLKQDLTPSEKQFLISIKEGTPEWSALGIPGIQNLPGIQWKLSNIQKMLPEKRKNVLEKLKEALSI